MPAKLRLQTGFLTRLFEQLLCALALGRLVGAARPAPGIRIASINVGERQLALLAAQELGQGDRVAATVPSIHTDDHMLEHLNSSRVCCTEASQPASVAHRCPTPSQLWVSTQLARRCATACAWPRTRPAAFPAAPRRRRARS